MTGGLGGAVAETVTAARPVPVVRLGLNETFAESGDYEDLQEKYGLTAEAIVRCARRAIKMA